MIKDKFYFMNAALKEARKAGAKDEVPVGAVAVKDGAIIARAHNAKERFNDATQHAEMRVLQKAAKKLGNWWLEEVDIYVTLEPCAMCAGAMQNARIRSLIYGAREPKTGAIESLFNILAEPKLNHKITVEGGIMADVAAALLSAFFAARRGKK